MFAFWVIIIFAFWYISRPASIVKLPSSKVIVSPIVISLVVPFAWSNISPLLAILGSLCIVPVVVIEPLSVTTTISPFIPSVYIELIVRASLSWIKIPPLIKFVAVIKAIVVSISASALAPIPVFALKFTIVVSPKIFSSSLVRLSLIAPVSAVILIFDGVCIIEISTLLFASMSISPLVEVI